MFLIFDTETTGLPKDFKAPITDFDNWPRLVQLAWQCHDVNGNFLFNKNLVIRPDGFEIPAESTKVHCITNELAAEMGVPLAEALAEFAEDVKKSRLVVGHNIQFDLNVVGCEYLRCQMPNVLDSATSLCTMNSSTEFCNIMFHGHLKSPKLSELHAKLFGNIFAEAHNAAADVEATTRCFLELVRRRVVPLNQLKMTDDEMDVFQENNPDVIRPVGIEFVSFKTGEIMGGKKTAEPQPAVEETKPEPEPALVDTTAAPRQFVHLHVHSHFSMLDGMSKIEDLVDKCMANNMPAIALTDHGNMYGVKVLADYCDKVNNKLKGKLGDLQKDLKKAGDNAEKAAEIQSQIDDVMAKIEKFVPIKPIFGIEAYCARRSHFYNKDWAEKNPDLKTKEDISGWHLILLAKNKTGYFNLCKLTSLSFIEGIYRRPRIDHELLEKYHEGIICCSACIGGEIPQYIMKGDLDKAEQSALWFKNLFGDDYYIEIQRHKTNKPNANYETYEEQQRVNPHLIEIARKHNIKIVCTNDVHFVEEDHAEAHDRLVCLSTGKRFYEDRMHYTKQEWLKTPDEMYSIFSDIPEAFENTLEVANKVECYDINSGPIMPKFPIPEDFGTEETYRQKFTDEDIYNEFTQDENGNVVMTREEGEKKIKKIGGYQKLYRIKLEADYLNKLAWEGAEVRYGKNLDQAIGSDGNPVSPEVVKKQITFELHVMKTMGFPGYFLIVRDYIRAAREELDCWVGPGRGSAAGSVVAYCLKITNIDPLRYDLLFERFLNPDRISLPDIDVDFEDCRRGDVIDWCAKRYGPEKLAHIITYGTMATKNSVADVCRVHDIPIPLTNALKGFVPDKFDDFKNPDSGKTFAWEKENENKKIPKINLKNCFKYVPQLKAAVNKEDNPELQALPTYSEAKETVADVLKYASQLENTNRQTGVHACGVIIGADDLTNYAPIALQEDKASGSYVTVTQYDGHVIESVGLIKMDFLGLSTLTLQKEAIRNIKKRHGIDIDIEAISLEDEQAYKLFSAGRTVGVFQFESPGMQKYLRELQPRKLTDLIAMNALYRPGPIAYIPTFIKRAQGREPISYDLPIMEKYLNDTYGVTVYQEQVMLLSRLLAGFTRGESDKLRKAMGKKQMAILAELKPKFINQAMENPNIQDGLEPKMSEDKLRETLEKIWKDWEAFASYAFNKSHAACYAWVAYQTGYLKANYPAEYMAATLTLNKDDIKEVTKFMEECKVMKIKVKGPNVNESELNFTVNKSGEILFGLGGIKGVGEAAVNKIVAEREKNGPFQSVFDFVERIDLSSCNKKTIESLAMAGAFDEITDIRREQFMGVEGFESACDVLIRYGNAFQNDKSSNVNTLFGDDLSAPIPKPIIPDVPEWSNIQRLNKEKEYVGIYLSAHPLDPYRFQIEYLCKTKLVDMTDFESKEGRAVSFAGIVTDCYTGLTKKGNPFSSFILEDYSGAYKVMLFGKNHVEYSKYAQKGLFLYVTGKIARREAYQRKGEKAPNQNEQPVEFQLNEIKLLDELDTDSMIKDITISANYQDVTEDMLTDLVDVVASCQGSTEMYINLVDSSAVMKPVRLFSRKIMVKVDGELVKKLSSIENLSFKIN